jgi:hypothetical protein
MALDVDLSGERVYGGPERAASRWYAPAMRRSTHLTLLSLAFAALVWAPASVTQTPAQPAKQPVPPFSAAKAGGPLPSGWQPLRFSALKHLTEYKLVEDQGVVVLDAKADAAASGLLDVVDFDIRTAPVMQWRWKIRNLIDDQDNSNAAKEDSPVRISLGFEGDKTKLGLRDRTASSLAKAGSGRELPYAELVYIWSNDKPVGTIIENPHTKRVQMVVAATGGANVGKWVTLKRNVYEDFKRAFGEEPGRVMEVGILTDTDNTGASTEGWYGDIEFVPATN